MSIYSQIKKHLMERHSITAIKAKAIIATAQAQPDVPEPWGFWSAESDVADANRCVELLNFCIKISDIWVQHFNS